MTILSNISYPYPVLGNNDDIEGEFRPISDGEVTADSVTINIKYNLKQQTIEQLIADGMAQYVAEVRCPGTFFRRTFCSQSPEHTITIPSAQLRDRIEINYFVVATSSFQYAPVAVASCFAGMNFTISPGDILALGGYTIEFIDKHYDPLASPAASFIQLRILETDRSGKISVDCEDDEFVFICIPQALYDDYNHIKNQFQDLVHSSIIFPALVDILYKIREDIYSDKTWCARLHDICDKIGLDIQIEEPITIAQEILKRPVERGIKSLDSINQDEEF